MPKEFTCPNCGAPLDYKGGDDLTLRCPFCSTSVVVPEELRTKAAPPAWGGFEETLGQARQLGEIKRLADARQMIEAIKLYRETFDTSLAQAKEAVEAIAAGRPVQITRQSVVQGPLVESFTPSDASPALRPSRRARPLAAVAAVFVLLVGLGVAGLAVVRGNSSGAGNQLGELVQAVVPPGFGTAKLRFGEEGNGPGHFEDARAMAVDSQGRIYVADYQGGRVQIFDADGKFVTQWNVGDKHTIIPALAADRSGHVFVVHDSRLFQYDARTGDELAEWEHPDGWGIEDIVATPDGGILAAWYKNRDDLVRFNSDGQPELVIKGAISTVADDSELDTHVAVDGEGSLYALGTFTTAVFKFSPQGKFLTRFGSDGDEPGQFRAPGAIAVDGRGRVYVSDFKGVQVFDGGGRYLDVVPVEGYAFGLTFDEDGFLYVSLGKQVIKYQINR